MKKTTFENSEETNRTFINDIYDWFDIIISAIVVIVLLFTFVFKIVGVDGSSMERTLHGGTNDVSAAHADRLIISNMFYTPKNGDIVVISRNHNNVAASDTEGPIIKRVIATEGQTVDIDFDRGKVIVDGKELDEPYVSSPIVQHDVEFPLVVDEGKIFVLGDNREVSLDSRSSEIGLVDTRYVLGKALCRIFPLGEFGSIYKQTAVTE